MTSPDVVRTARLDLVPLSPPLVAALAEGDLPRAAALARPSWWRWPALRIAARALAVLRRRSRSAT